MDPAAVAWLRSVAAQHDPRVTGDTSIERIAGDGVEHALVVAAGPVVAKFHLARTDPGELSARLVFAASSTTNLAPLRIDPLRAPNGSLASLWPRVEALTPADHPPWAEAGALLAELHRTPLRTDLPEHGGPARLERAIRRLDSAPSSTAVTVLRRTADALVSARTRRDAGPGGPGSHLGPRPLGPVHGDWHLGQLGRPSLPERSWSKGGDGWRLLDIDDLGVGDPAWDLGRPAGFWAAGLLEDGAWAALLGAYQAAGGPAVPPKGDPWPALDQAARAAVLIAATAAVLRPGAHSPDTADALIAACARMHDR